MQTEIAIAAKILIVVPSAVLLFPDTLNRSVEPPGSIAGASKTVLELNNVWQDRLVSYSNTEGSVQEAGRLSL